MKTLRLMASLVMAVTLFGVWRVHAEGGYTVTTENCYSIARGCEGCVGTCMASQNLSSGKVNLKKQTSRFRSCNASK
jgi:hypothetical protein